MELIDPHCHLDVKAFAQDREAVLQRARVARQARAVAVGEIGLDYSFNNRCPPERQASASPPKWSSPRTSTFR